MTIENLFGIFEHHGYILQILLAEALFLPVFKRRNRFWLRLGIGLPFYLAFSWIMANIIHFYASEFTSFAIFLFSFGLVLVLFKNPFKTLLFCCIGAQLIQNLSHNVEGLFYIPFSSYYNDVGRFFLSVGVMAVIYVIAYFAIIRPIKNDIKSAASIKGSFILAVISVLFCYVIQTLIRRLVTPAHWIVVTPLIFCDLTTLCFSFVFVSYVAKQNENRELERLIAQSDRYYEMVSANIEAVNIKAHDLKHFIAGAEEKMIDPEGLQELKKAVEEYATTSKTGNKALDNVLTNYTLQFHNEGIPFSFSLDASHLSFMRPQDLTSLFGNLLSNSLEAEKKTKEKEKRFASFKINKKGGMLSLHFENYWSEEVLLKDGFPVSTKSNRDSHGFGLRSVAYIVERYGGTLSFAQNGEVFGVNILFPKQN